MPVQVDDMQFFADQVMLWGKHNFREFPWRNQGVTPYGILVAEVLLRKTTSHQVESMYAAFMARFPDPESILDVPQELLLDAVRPLGLYKQRVVALTSIAQVVKDRGMPQCYGQVRELPHVGQYISAAVSCFAFAERQPVVDSNVIRLYSRFFGLSGLPDNRRNKQVGDLASEILPDRGYVLFNYSLLDFAAAVCTGRGKPHCHGCPLQVRCAHADYGLSKQPTGKSKRAKRQV